MLVKISACGTSHTELDEIEGRTPPTRFPVIPGHQVVGMIEIFFYTQFLTK
ncbi:MAG: alcohol dehydrogenase catalytic domain-containing protein [Planctomycetes bacterium]|nr:alcohol dehydrogenase catalytic domain-containing protein [Planctomycetota bacterium]